MIISGNDRFFVKKKPDFDQKFPKNRSIIDKSRRLKREKLKKYHEFNIIRNGFRGLVSDSVTRL